MVGRPSDKLTCLHLLRMKLLELELTQIYAVIIKSKHVKDGPTFISAAQWLSVNEHTLRNSVVNGLIPLTI